MQNPLVSIITPTYNHAKYIRQCVESVLSQTYDNWEQIIIDDGSTDGTLDVLDEYKDEPRIKIIKQKHVGIEGLSYTYNKALGMAKGELIAILEGDDFWPKYKLERQIEAFRDDKIILTWGKAVGVSDDGKILGVFPQEDITEFERLSKIEFLRRFMVRNYIPACTVIIRKKALIRIGGFIQPEGALAVDYYTWLKLTLVGEFKAINKILGFWRIHRGQVTMVSSTRVLRFAEVYYRYLTAFLNELPEDLRREIGISYIDIRKNYAKRLASYLIFRAHLAMLHGKWKNANSLFKKSMQISGFTRQGIFLPKYFLASLTGLLLTSIQRRIPLLDIVASRISRSYKLYKNVYRQ